MYLLVFVTLVISMIGLYAQTLVLQAARFNAGQATAAQAMLIWHELPHPNNWLSGELRGSCWIDRHHLFVVRV
jgi:hypothetical protein